MKRILAAEIMVVFIIFLLGFLSCASSKKSCKKQKIVIILAAVDYCKNYQEKDKSGCILDSGFPALASCEDE